MNSILRDPDFILGLQETVEGTATRPVHIIVIAIEEEGPDLVTISMSKMAYDSDLLASSSVRDALLEAAKILAREHPESCIEPGNETVN